MQRANSCFPAKHLCVKSKKVQYTTLGIDSLHLKSCFRTGVKSLFFVSIPRDIMSRRLLLLLSTTTLVSCVCKIFLFIAFFNIVSVNKIVPNGTHPIAQFTKVVDDYGVRDPRQCNRTHSGYSMI